MIVIFANIGNIGSVLVPIFTSAFTGTAAVGGFAGAASSGGDVPLHNACFDYNDDVLLTGAEFFVELVYERLS